MPDLILPDCFLRSSVLSVFLLLIFVEVRIVSSKLLLKFGMVPRGLMLRASCVNLGFLGSGHVEELQVAAAIHKGSETTSVKTLEDLKGGARREPRQDLVVSEVVD